MPDPFQLSAQINAPSVQDFSALQSKMDALRSGVQPMQGAAQVDDGWGAVDQSLNIAPKMPVLPPVPSNNQGMMFPNADGSHFDVKPRGQKLITQVADNQFQRDFDQAEKARQARVDAIKAGVTQDDYASRRTRELQATIAQQQALRAQLAGQEQQQQQAYRDQVRQYRASMPQQEPVDPYVPMWRQMEYLSGTPEERRARGWR